MNELALLDSILSDDFKVTERTLEEQKEGMSVVFETRKGCVYLNYKYDDVPAGYKGGLFPFFSNTQPGVRSICDYIIFAKKGSTIFAIVFELKKGKGATMPQFRAAEVFVNYIIDTAKRIGNIPMQCKVRYVSVREYQIKKGKTLKKEIEYDANGHYELKCDKFCLNDFIK